MMNAKAKPTLHWGILGAGGIAGKFVTGARATESKNVVSAVASNSAGKAATFAASYDIPHAFDGYEALLELDEIEAVYVANTHNFHHETVLLALDAGKHVLCEKPLAVNAHQAKAMMEKAASKKLFLMEAMWTRFLPACRQLMTWIHEGRIGEIRHIEASFGFKGDWSAEGRMRNPALAGGALLDMGIYPLSFASFVMAGQTPTSFQSLLTFGPTGVDEDDVLLLGYPDDVKALLRTSFRANLECRATVLGSCGKVTLPHVFIGQTKAVLETEEEIVTKNFPMPGDQGFRHEIEHAAECIRSGKLESPLMPLRETLVLAETMDAVRKQWNFQYPFE